MIEGDREVIEDTKADDMFIAEGDDKSARGLKIAYPDGTSISCELNVPSISKPPTLVPIGRLSFKKVGRH